MGITDLLKFASQAFLILMYCCIVWVFYIMYTHYFLPFFSCYLQILVFVTWNKTKYSLAIILFLNYTKKLNKSVLLCKQKMPTMRRTGQIPVHRLGEDARELTAADLAGIRWYIDKSKFMKNLNVSYKLLQLFCIFNLSINQNNFIQKWNPGLEGICHKRFLPLDSRTSCEYKAMGIFLTVVK